MKHNVMATANALALTLGVVYVACAALVAFFPDFFKAISVSWFHGFDLGQFWTGEARGNYLLGLISAMAGSWLVGYLFAFVYNKFVK